jgi:hypothetical protein
MSRALTAEQRGALIKTYGTVDDAIREAQQRSPELQELWNSQYTIAWWPYQGDFEKVWWKAALPVLGVDSAPPVSVEKPGKRAAKGSAGAPDALYDREEIKRALCLWRDRATSPQQISQASIARPGFSRTAVRRVIRLDEHGAFERGPRGGLRLLGIRGEFRAAPKKVSLRALERALGLTPLA